MQTIEKYGLFELRVKGPAEPTALFTREGALAEIPVKCFRISEQESAIRFMPGEEGIWKYHVGNNSGEFLCTPNTGNNHGPVVTESSHFRYADGSAYYPVGTTLYAWIHQTPELIAQTLKTLKSAPFNKVRMCIFPKRFDFNWNEPELYPFFKREDGSWDAEQPDFRFWSRLDESIQKLCDLGIEADLILFHPYDSWGFSNLSREESLVYLDYCIRRLSAYRNIWWSLANEYDLVSTKTIEDWYAFGEKLASGDAYGHLISVHNWMRDFPKVEWMTHCSIQGDVHKVIQTRKEYELPVIMDEFGYEGNIPFGWGNLSAFEEVHRAWQAAAYGGYVTHGETYYRDDEVLWWSKGGKLYGESAARFAFLKSVLYEIGRLDLVVAKSDLAMANNQSPPNPVHAHINAVLSQLPESTRSRMFMPVVGANRDYRLIYLGRSCPCYQDISLPENGVYRVEAIDVWEMTRTAVDENASGLVRIHLPGKEGIAVLVTHISGEDLDA